MVGKHFDAVEEWVEMSVIRACGHAQTLVVQEPVDFIQGVAEGEPCVSCAGKTGAHGTTSRIRKTFWFTPAFFEG